MSRGVKSSSKKKAYINKGIYDKIYDVMFILLVVLVLSLTALTFIEKHATKSYTLEKQLNDIKSKEALKYEQDIKFYTNLFISINQKLSDREAKLYAHALLSGSIEFDVDPDLFFSLIVIESGAKSKVVSSAGAIGIAQIMPFHLALLKKEKIFNNHRDFYDGVKSIRGGMFLFSNFLKWADMNTLKALGAYNAGRGNWRAGLGYAQKVLRIKNKYW